MNSLMSSDLDPFSGHLASPFCSQYIVQDYIVWFEVRRHAGVCGTVLTTNRTHAIYSNSLFFYSTSNDSLIPSEAIHFSCVYPLETNAGLNVVIRPQQLEGGLLGSGPKATAYIYLYRDSDFRSRYPPGWVNLTVGSALNVEVSVEERDFSFEVVLERCYTTPSSDPDYLFPDHLIRFGCPIDHHHVIMVENGRARRARFSALLFPVQSDSPYIFLHCSLRLCDDRLNSCVPSCRGRAPRSVPSSAQLDLLSIGPITWIK
ncbi:pancreatic secretory granule membrane major glycoprotein GP2-like [Stegastes partitus]|uniref:Pancreatic secretory granule membrane major glycoprotein GP2-like n=1 Tax=Stegastes partitus TaxID=144197 RepID=A0A9Y4KBR0_9TELE|nr:PREDICTED: pancreatic secretory granule membrane major glycoprotein GP2-like [Stegastes partitus]